MKTGSRWRVRSPRCPPCITPVERLAQDLEHTDPETTSGLLMVLSHHPPLALPKALCLPGSQPGARFWRDLGRRPVLLWTAHSAAKAAAPCVSGRRQGANAVPGGSRAPRRGRTALGRGPAGGETLPSSTSNPTLGHASRPGAPGPGDGMRPRLPGVPAQCARGLSGLVALPPAHPVPLAAWARPRGRPHLEAGDRVGRIRGAASRGRWNVRRGEERRSLHPTLPHRSLLTAPHRPRPGGPGSAPVRGADPAPAAGGSAAPGRARRAPVSAGLRLQPRSTRGPLRHRPPGRAGG